MNGKQVKNNITCNCKYWHVLVFLVSIFIFLRAIYLLAYDMHYAVVYGIWHIGSGLRGGGGLVQLLAKGNFTVTLKG